MTPLGAPRSAPDRPSGHRSALRSAPKSPQRSRKQKGRQSRPGVWGRSRPHRDKKKKPTKDSWAFSGLPEENEAGWTGLEPAASGVTGRRYNQLNYHPNFQGLRAACAEFRTRRPWAGQGSNLRPSVCKTNALPLSYPPCRRGRGFYPARPFGQAIFSRDDFRGRDRAIQAVFRFDVGAARARSARRRVGYTGKPSLLPPPSRPCAFVSSPSLLLPSLLARSRPPRSLLARRTPCWVPRTPGRAEREGGRAPRRTRRAPSPSVSPSRDRSPSSFAGTSPREPGARACP